MNQLTKFLVDSILNEGDESLSTVALFGGGFKPPTKGHLDVVLQGLRDNPEVKQVYILVGSGVRNGITQEESVKIWKIYKRFIPVSTQIVAVQSPFSYIKTYLQDHQDENVYIFIGARPDNDEDEKDVAERSAYAKKYSEKAFPVKVTTPGNISGTKARAAAKQSKEAFLQFIPSKLTDSEKESIYQMVVDVVKEKINENASYSSDINVKEKILELTKHMLAKGMNIKPLPKVKFVNGDSNNAREFLGKTAYYNPENQTITLYTEGRHPKDIVKSFSHEMIHHIQNLEDRLGDISTTNTMEDDNINKLEQEANLKGTMTFRNWTDSLNEGKQVSTIYHYTTFEAGLKILQSNQFRSGEAADSTNAKPVFAVSFTRDKRFHDSHVVGFDESSFGNKPQLRFTIDGNKLSNRFSVQPHSQGGAFSKNRKGFEAEERVVSNKPFTIPLSDYLMSVDVLLEYKKTSNKYDILSIVDYEMYAPLRAKIIKFAQDKNLPINLIVNKNGDPWPDKVKNTLIQKILDWFTMKEANLKGTMTFRNWTDSLNESLIKNSNHLYHWTSYSSCKKIIESNKLKSNESNQFFEYDESRVLPDYKNVVFFTIEDERFADEETSNQCILVVDKSKLSKDYKVISYGDPYEETVVYTNDSSIPILPYLKGVLLMNTLQKSGVKNLVQFLELKNIPYEINDNLEKEVKAKQAKLPTLKKELINKLKSKYPNGFIGYLNTPLISRQTPEYFKDNPTYSYPNITINKLGEYGEKNKFQVKFKIEPQNLEKYINWFMYSPDSIEDLINMDNYEGEELYLKGDIPIDPATLLEANLKGTMTFRNWTDSLNEDLSNISLDYIKTKLPKLDSYPKSDIILSKGDFVYLEIPQDVNNPYSMVYEVKVFDIKDGTLVAQSSFDYDNNNKLKGTLDVRPDKRRMGIATEIYKLAEKVIGDTIFPEEKHTEDAEKFWRQKNRSFGPQNYDSLNEVKYTNPNFELEWEEAVRYPEFKEMGKENWIKVAKQGKLVNYSSIKDVLGNVDLDFDNLEEPKKQRFQSAFKNGTVETPIAVKFSDNDYDLVAGNTRLSGLIKNGVNPKIWVIDISNIQEKKNKDPFGLNQFAREIAEEVISEGRYDTLANKLSSIAFKAFKDIHDRGDKEGSFKFRVDTPDDEHDIPSEDFYFDFEGVVEITDGEYGVDGGANAGFDTDGNEITPLLSVKFKIPKNPSNIYPTWQDISFDIKDVIRHELEHLTQDGDNEKPGKYIEDDQLLRDLIDAKLLPKAQYFKLEKEIDAMLQGLYFKAKKLKRPYKKVIDDYLATQSITQEEKNDILKIWRSRVKALSLPLFESEGISELFTIYLDIDGVIADFDKRFTELAGMGPREYEDSFGSEKFWDFIDIKHKIKFFSKMDWMPEGKKLYNFIKQFDHKLLSAPSKNDASKVGKRIWAKENTPETQLILSPAYNKKNYADKSNILIDDRESNIQQWKDAGGIGILFKSTDQVIDELKKIMNL
jgi:phosphopantetheine adenylyltransferase